MTDCSRAPGTGGASFEGSAPIVVVSRAAESLSDYVTKTLQIRDQWWQEDEEVTRRRRKEKGRGERDGRMPPLISGSGVMRTPGGD